VGVVASAFGATSPFARAPANGRSPPRSGRSGTPRG
jgi:hypothetical protein